jgi:hypothetical protein
MLLFHIFCRDGFFRAGAAISTTAAVAAVALIRLGYPILHFVAIIIANVFATC